MSGEGDMTMKVGYTDAYREAMGMPPNDSSSHSNQNSWKYSQTQLTTAQGEVSTRKEVMKKDTKKIVQIPGSFFPHASFESALWLVFTAKELKSTTTAGRGGALNIGKTGTTFKFLAPEIIIESHNHDWAPYESVQSKLLQKVLAWKKAGGEIGDIYNSLKNEIAKVGKTFPAGQQMANVLQTGFGTQAPKFKVDTPLAYTNSQRRQWQFTFQLADARGGIEVIEAVKDLMVYAAPKSEGVLDIQFPWLFTIASEPQGLIDCSYSALTSIQPSWMTPYIKGRPTRCELTLAFTDMSPLFETTIQRGGIINVITPEDTAFRKDAAALAAGQAGKNGGPGKLYTGGGRSALSDRRLKDNIVYI